MKEKTLLTLIPPWMYERGVSEEGIGTTDVNPGEERSTKGEACGVILYSDRSDFARTPQNRENKKAKPFLFETYLCAKKKTKTY